MARVLLLLLRAYRALSWRRVPACRYHPTCSSYAYEAVEIHGAWRGGLLAARRLGRCHPWGGSGFDPVPARDRMPARLTPGRAVDCVE